ncbi:MAG: 50S ribosomal protein L21 [Planctomycetota bacterium]|nr:MAG: 50S ribosomal protein L21 [Planctomycetota bacterium]
MYAIIQDRTRQLTVREDEIVDLDWHSGWKAGDKISFDQVLVVGKEGTVKVGRPLVAGAKVSAEVIGEKRGEKLVVFRFRRRKNVRRKRGHRQDFTSVKITKIHA